MNSSIRIRWWRFDKARSYKTFLPFIKEDSKCNKRISGFVDRLNKDFREFYWVGSLVLSLDYISS